VSETGPAEGESDEELKWYNLPEQTHVLGRGLRPPTDEEEEPEERTYRPMARGIRSTDEGEPSEGSEHPEANRRDEEY
jgi:hypothetical protein